MKEYHYPSRRNLRRELLAYLRYPVPAYFALLAWIGFIWLAVQLFAVRNALCP